MALLEAADPLLEKLVAPDAAVLQIAAGMKFTEGPLWLRDALLFSDIHSNRTALLRRTAEGPELTTFSKGPSNGMTLDARGRILLAEHHGRKVSVVAEDGSRTTLVDSFEGKHLNSPNDIIVKSDGAVYFTDPPYGIQWSPGGTTRPPNWWEIPLPGKEQPCNGVYRLLDDGRMDRLVDDFALPNGLAFSPDERVLYIDDSARSHIRAFEVLRDGTLGEGRVLLDMSSADPNVADGMKVDLDGNIFCTGPGGIWVCRPDGRFLGRIILPELPANLAWGDDGTVLYVTARTSIYRLPTRTRGALLGLEAVSP